MGSKSKLVDLEVKQDAKIKKKRGRKKKIDNDLGKNLINQRKETVFVCNNHDNSTLGDSLSLLSMIRSVIVVMWTDVDHQPRHLFVGLIKMFISINLQIK